MNFVNARDPFPSFQRPRLDFRAAKTYRRRATRPADRVDTTLRASRRLVDTASRDELRRATPRWWQRRTDAAPKSSYGRYWIMEAFARIQDARGRWRGGVPAVPWRWRGRARDTHDVKRRWTAGVVAPQNCCRARGCVRQRHPIQRRLAQISVPRARARQGGKMKLSKYETACLPSVEERPGARPRASEAELKLPRRPRAGRDACGRSRPLRTTHAWCRAHLSRNSTRDLDDVGGTDASTSARCRDTLTSCDTANVTIRTSARGWLKLIGR